MTTIAISIAIPVPRFTTLFPLRGETIRGGKGEYILGNIGFWGSKTGTGDQEEEQ